MPLFAGDPGVQETHRIVDQVASDHHKHRLQPVRARDGELQVHRLVLGVLREHTALRVRHMNERLRRERDAHASPTNNRRIIMASADSPPPADPRLPGTSALAPAPRSAARALSRAGPTRAASARAWSRPPRDASPCASPHPPAGRAAVRCSPPAGPRSARSPPPDRRSCIAPGASAHRPVRAPASPLPRIDPRARDSSDPRNATDAPAPRRSRSGPAPASTARPHPKSPTSVRAVSPASLRADRDTAARRSYHPYPTMLSPPSTRKVFPVSQYVAGWRRATMHRATSSSVVKALVRPTWRPRPRAPESTLLRSGYAATSRHWPPHRDSDGCLCRPEPSAGGRGGPRTGAQIHGQDARWGEVQQRVAEGEGRAGAILGDLVSILPPRSTGGGRHCGGLCR